MSKNFLWIDTTLKRNTPKYSVIDLSYVPVVLRHRYALLRNSYDLYVAKRQFLNLTTSEVMSFE